ncbi:MAG: MmcQ/YjbR family DNA-binding protein [Nitriliruptorales bacterium]|nr:MmcQ/YjbR family DNA-binding protein [Nitriliruptorales bacterium]
MDSAELRAMCLAKPGATQGYPFGPGALVMKVAGKVFAIISDDEEPPAISLKCEPELAVALRQSYEAVNPGYHLNKRHWNTVTADGSADDKLREWIDDSYDLIVASLPRRVRTQLS